MTKNEIYKMIFAKNDDQEQQIKADIIDKAKKLGVVKEVQWVKDDREKARTQYEAAHKK